MSRAWRIVISDHAEYRRGGRQVWVYDPCVLPEGASIQSREVRYCGHRHSSYEAAVRCGERLRREAERADRNPRG